MMSPDGKWVWNGQQWIPVAVHESVFPAYTGATAAADAAGPVAPAVSSPASPFGMATAPAAPAVVSPAIVGPPSYSAGGAVPPWQRYAVGKRSTYMYGGAAFVVVVIGVILTVAIGQNVLPFLHTSNGATPTPTAKASPTPQLAVRSQAAVADRYVTSTFLPAVANLATPIRDEFEACSGQLSFSCQNALNAVEQQLVISQAPLAKATPPACIAPQVARVRADLTAIDQGVQLALGSFKNTNTIQMRQGLTRLNAGSKPLNSDIQAVQKAPALVCNGQPEGP
jgi:hypothetical protein